jgi:tryptophan-rich sensory protein
MKIKDFFVSVLVPLAVGGVSALVTMGSMDVYSTLNSPPFAPPSLLFPIVWTLLYFLMGVSAYLIKYSKNGTEKEKSTALFTYGLSLFFNFFWSIVFFRFRWFLFAFIWLLVLWFLILKTILDYVRIRPSAAYLQIPYLVWVSFAGYLNLAFWYLNR